MPWSQHATNGERRQMEDLKDEFAAVSMDGDSACFMDMRDTKIPDDATFRDRCCAIGADGNPCLSPAVYQTCSDIKDADGVIDNYGITAPETNADSFVIRATFCEECYERFGDWMMLVKRVNEAIAREGISGDSK